MACIGKGQDDVLASLEKGCSSSKKIQRPGLCMLVDIIDPYLEVFICLLVLYILG